MKREKTPFLSKCIAFFWKTDRFLDRVVPLLSVLLLVVVLRIPTFFEPYWYGDEAIYLTIGHALRTGSLLYADIVDHKTPLIYYFAMVPSQLWFRVLLLGWMLFTTTAFYQLTKRLIAFAATNSLVSTKKPTVSNLFQNLLTFTSTVLFVLLTTLPWLEGTIPNGELFVMGFILVGGWLFMQTQLAQSYFKDSSEQDTLLHAQSNRSLSINKDVFFMAASGISFGLAILTKMPALFDVAAFLAVGWFLTARAIAAAFQTKNSHGYTQVIPIVLKTIQSLAWVMLPIILSILYFWLRGSLTAYLEFGLLYNFHYVQTWVPSFPHEWIGTLFTLPAKLLITIGIILGITLLGSLQRSRISSPVQFAATWSILALFASLLSNRPYPHYFLQLVPPLIMLGVVVIITIISIIQSSKNLKTNRISTSLYAILPSLLVTIFIFILNMSALSALQVGYYPVRKYYQTAYQYLSGQLSQAEYYHSFSSRMDDNYSVLPLLAESPDPKLFIWGTNPELYALSKKVPVGRFTVSFHIKDLKLYEETMQAVNDYKPHYIIVMKNETEDLPGLTNLLVDEYVRNTSFDQFDVWKRIQPVQ